MGVIIALYSSSPCASMHKFLNMYLRIQLPEHTQRYILPSALVSNSTMLSGLVANLKGMPPLLERELSEKVTYYFISQQYIMMLGICHTF